MQKSAGSHQRHTSTITASLPPAVGWQTGADITALKAAAATGLPAGGQGLPNSMPRDAYNGASLTRLAARHGAPLTGASGIGARALLL